MPQVRFDFVLFLRNLIPCQLLTPLQLQTSEFVPFAGQFGAAEGRLSCGNGAMWKDESHFPSTVACTALNSDSTDDARSWTETG